MNHGVGVQCTHGRQEEGKARWKPTRHAHSVVRLVVFSCYHLLLFFLYFFACSTPWEAWSEFLWASPSPIKRLDGRRGNVFNEEKRKKNIIIRPEAPVSRDGRDSKEMNGSSKIILTSWWSFCPPPRVYFNNTPWAQGGRERDGGRNKGEFKHSISKRWTTLTSRGMVIHQI